jgi:hypothetical protein
MGRKSFLSRLEIDVAQKAHNCQHSKKHRIEKGNRRLKVSDGYAVSHYCIECAIKFLKLDAQTIDALLCSMQSHGSTSE